MLQALQVDYIDESEVLTPADDRNHIDKRAYTVPFVCGAASLGEALRRIGEGAAAIRVKGEAGSGDIVQAVRHLRLIRSQIRRLPGLGPCEMMTSAKELEAPAELVRDVARAGRLPVPLFCAGGIATPADAALVMQLGAEAVFVGSGIFRSADPERRAAAIVHTAAHYQDPEQVLQASRGLGEAMPSIETARLAVGERLAARGPGLVRPAGERTGGPGGRRRGRPGRVNF
jgi:pyridoxal 5'-phosphate synthase pdxS subunit